MSRRGFTDAAGYTIHCLECVHADGWTDGRGRCDLTGRIVYKADSPNNQCSRLGFDCRYKTDDQHDDAVENIEELLDGFAGAYADLSLMADGGEPYKRVRGEYERIRAEYVDRIREAVRDE